MIGYYEIGGYKCQVKAKSSTNRWTTVAIMYDETKAENWLRTQRENKDRRSRVMREEYMVIE